MQLASGVPGSLELRMATAWSGAILGLALLVSGEWLTTTVVQASSNNEKMIRARLPQY